MPTIAILATLDTKGLEAGFLKEQIQTHGCHTLVIDLGIQGAPAITPDITRETVAEVAGGTVENLAISGDRGRAVSAMTRGIEKLVRELYSRGRLQGVIGIGGSAGTAMATAAMRTLPLGIPKVMISTIAGGDVKAFVDITDIIMIPSIVDISGLNRISRQVIAQAAAAVAGMVQVKVPEGEDRPLIAASMFGNTTSCVEMARDILEEAEFEVLVFHATGTGGRTMESLIQANYVSGVFDATTTELADELLGGVMSAGPTRLTTAAEKGIAAVVAPGCLDMVNFWAPETVPEKYRGRLLYQHNPNVTLMRTTPEESQELGRRFAERINISRGPVAVFLPLKGISVISAPGQPFHWPEADQALFDVIKEKLRHDIPLHELDLNINDAPFARAMAEELLRELSARKGNEAV